MKKILLAAAIGTLLSAPAFAQWAAPATANGTGNYMVRVRAVHLDSANKDSTGLGLSVNDKWLPELDVSYFINRNLAAELILTVPQKHDVNASALGGKIGTLKQLPPTLLLQYHFDLGNNAYGIKPYVGAGVNYTHFSSVRLPAGVDVDRSSWGGALQLGVDIPLARNVYFNVDVKKVYLGTDVKNKGAKIGSLKVDPVLVGVGLGYRF